MSLDSVRQFLQAHAPDIQVIITEASSATVPEAAAAHGVTPGQIAKTLCLKVKDRMFLVVLAGDARLDNSKVKGFFGGKPSMPDAAEVSALTGHPIGGVCPFGLATPLEIFCDASLEFYDEVVPAAGSRNSAVRISPRRMAELTNARWIDISRRPGE